VLFKILDLAFAVLREVMVGIKVFKGSSLWCDGLERRAHLAAPACSRLSPQAGATNGRYPRIGTAPASPSPSHPTNIVLVFTLEPEIISRRNLGLSVGELVRR